MAKTVKEKKTEEYLHELIKNIMKRAASGEKVSANDRAKRQLNLTLAPEVDENREDIIERSQKFKRLKL